MDQSELAPALTPLQVQCRKHLTSPISRYALAVTFLLGVLQSPRLILMLQSARSGPAGALSATGVRVRNRNVDDDLPMMEGNRTSALAGGTGKSPHPSSSSQPPAANVSLRLDWSALRPVSRFARAMAAHQSDCSLPHGELRMRNTAGLGSDLHLWSQALCHAMELRVRSLTKMPWVYRDVEACQKNHSATTDNEESALSCYFPQSEPPCPRDRDFIAPSNSGASGAKNITKLFYGTGGVHLGTCDNVLGRYNATKSDLRGAAMEYLFSPTDPVVVQEAVRQLVQVFGRSVSPPPPSHHLVTVHMRWGDKGKEMELQPVERYVDAVLNLTRAANLTGSEVNVFVATEDPRAVQAFRAAARPHRWNVFVDEYLREYESSRIPGHAGHVHLAGQLHGRPGLVALASALVALQSDMYVLTSGSNWSRLLDELRRSVVDPRCGGCTAMIDLTPGVWQW